MSSACSVNSCISLEMTSSNELINNKPSVECIKNSPSTVKKDSKYWDRRRRNNEAARRSREKRRLIDMGMDNRISELSKRNKQLENELLIISKKSSVTASKVLLAQTFAESDKSGFPILGTLKSEKSVYENTNSMAAMEFLNSLDINKNNNKYLPSDILTISGIPFLANFLVAQASNEDITTKPTLLLPQFQVPSNTVNSLNIKDSQSPGRNRLKKIKQRVSKNSEIIDQVASDRVLGVSGDMSSLLPVGVAMNQVSNETVIEKTVNNSFLSGADRNLISKHNSFTKNCDIQPRSKDLYKGGFLGQKCRGNIPSQHGRIPTTGRIISQRSKLLIQQEVSRAIISENSKLHDTINCLSDEIKELKSIILSLVAPSIFTNKGKPPENH